MTTRRRVLKVFLSYARVDAESVVSLYEMLSAEKVDIWHDKRKLLGGQDWEREIRKAVRESDVVIICLSKEFNKKGYRQKEVRIALEESKLRPEGEIFIIPVCLEECDVMEDLQRWQRVDLYEEDGFENILRALCMRASEIGLTFRSKRSKSSKKVISQSGSEKLVPDYTLIKWLGMHSLVANPFGRVSIKSYPLYPEGVTRPVQWEAFMDPDPLFAHCPTAEDAQTLAFLLREECLPQKSVNQKGINRWIFPIWVWHQQTTPIQSPLLTLTSSAARAWLDILPTNPDLLLLMPLAEQNAVLELLYWSIGSNRAILNLLQLNGLKEDRTALALTRKISLFKKDRSNVNAPRDAVLISWLKIKPGDMERTYVILPMDSLYSVLPPWWFEQFNSLIPTLSMKGIVTKAIDSLSSPTSLSLSDINLSWSNDWLKRSLDGQFDAVMDKEEKLMGKSIRFPELFGPGVTDEKTTRKLISASHYSLARMLTLGNRLLQKHCEQELPEKYLSPDELDDILKVA